VGDKIWLTFYHTDTDVKSIVIKPETSKTIKDDIVVISYLTDRRKSLVDENASYTVHMQFESHEKAEGFLKDLESDIEKCGGTAA
jgi:hypothetical protein